jgi:hypothetical protein
MVRPDDDMAAALLVRTSRATRDDAVGGAWVGSLAYAKTSSIGALITMLFSIFNIGVVLV